MSLPDSLEAFGSILRHFSPEFPVNPSVNIGVSGSAGSQV